uniref:Uncharacterized protein n=1 Tax=Alexandrium andersonii TaxID=327968 RepID=A0A7S2BCD8_9DINO|mmetsp:Transcript_2431/g.5459  ORF Transcript_2431/g.5459 Transcript_2431/m.5459 type:complete len:195 (+) Transcript_2431:109-693(+)
MYGALDATKKSNDLLNVGGEDLEDAASGIFVEPGQPLEASRVLAALLQLFLWVGAWGAVDALVWLAAADRPEWRFTLYSLTAASGAVAAPLLLRAKRKAAKHGGGTSGSAAQDCGHLLGTPETFHVLGFAVAVALCAGLWGMIDSLVEVVAGERNDRQFVWYLFLTVVASLGVAVHHQFWPHQVLGVVGQLTIV